MRGREKYKNQHVPSKRKMTGLSPWLSPCYKAVIYSLGSQGIMNGSVVPTPAWSFSFTKNLFASLCVLILLAFDLFPRFLSV